MSITSDSDVCNMANGYLGNYDSINSITAPQTDQEKVYALWYDVSRETFLKTAMPNCALRRRIVARVDEIPAFGFANVYEYPEDCLKILGIGNVACKRNNYTIEGNRLYTDEDYPEGLPMRFIFDLKDITAWSPEAVMGFALYLAIKVCMSITGDGQKMRVLWSMMPDELSSLSALNAQENAPIRISRSLYKQARFNGYPTNVSKK